VRVERSRQFGDVYLALPLWRGTGLAELCAKLLPVGTEAVPWPKMAAVLVAGRLCEEPSVIQPAPMRILTFGWPYPADAGFARNG
jgi:hypothetical protein